MPEGERPEHLGLESVNIPCGVLSPTPQTLLTPWQGLMQATWALVIQVGKGSGFLYRFVVVCAGFSSEKQ